MLAQGQSSSAERVLATDVSSGLIFLKKKTHRLKGRQVWDQETKKGPWRETRGIPKPVPQALSLSSGLSQ